MRALRPLPAAIAMACAVVVGLVACAPETSTGGDDDREEDGGEEPDHRPEEDGGACATLVGDPTRPRADGCCPAGFDPADPHAYYPGGRPRRDAGACAKVFLDESIATCGLRVRCRDRDDCPAIDVDPERCERDR